MSSKRSASSLADSCSNGPTRKRRRRRSSTFSCLPQHITERVVQYLPISSFATMASLYWDWKLFAEKWVLSSRSFRRICNDIARLMPSADDDNNADEDFDDCQEYYDDEDDSDDEKNKEESFDSLCAGIGGLLLAGTRATEDAVGTRIGWLNRLLKEMSINLKSEEKVLCGFGLYLNKCFELSEPPELKKVTHAIFAKSRLKISLNRLFTGNVGVGEKIKQEAKIRLFVRTIFIEERLAVAALKNLTINPQGLLPPGKIAKLLFLLFGPKDGVFVDWAIILKTKLPARCLEPLGRALNFSFWLENPYKIESILKCLLRTGERDCRWSSGAVDALRDVLSENLVKILGS